MSHFPDRPGVLLSAASRDGSRSDPEFDAALPGRKFGKKVGVNPARL
jgi:hypothetical protein